MALHHDKCIAANPCMDDWEIVPVDSFFRITTWNSLIKFKGTFSSREECVRALHAAVVDQHALTLDLMAQIEHPHRSTNQLEEMLQEYRCWPAVLLSELQDLSKKKNRRLLRLMLRQHQLPEQYVSDVLALFPYELEQGDTKSYLDWVDIFYKMVDFDHLRLTTDQVSLIVMYTEGKLGNTGDYYRIIIDRIIQRYGQQNFDILKENARLLWL